MTTPPPSTFHVINDPETLRLIADPLRLRLLELIRQEARTVSELAELLDVPRTRLYYHIKLLESHDLIAVEETRVVSGLTEKRYRVTAYRLSVDKSLIGAPEAGSAPLDVFLSVVLDETAAEIRRSIASGLIAPDRMHEEEPHARGLFLGRTWLRLTPERLAEFRDRYVALYEEFAADATRDALTPSGSESLYEWLGGFFPIVPPSSPHARGQDHEGDASE
ncbi:MAG: helix-turn-helix domain-containing protein [Thermomicrobiales bacterium]